MTPADIFSFVLAWASNPRRVGAVAPSGRALATLMTSGISPQTGPVLELGPGTGVFTRALLARDVKEQDLTLVERDPEFAWLLGHRFPAARVLLMDAARLDREELTQHGPAGAVVSGLPLRSFSPGEVYSILSAAFACMRPDGAFYQFTYGPRCSVPHHVLKRLGLEARRVGHAFANVPPAAVYRISRSPYDPDAHCEPGVSAVMSANGGGAEAEGQRAVA